MWVRAPTPLTRSMTASTSCSVAVDFITIIISSVLSGAWKLYESGNAGFHPTGGFFGARLGDGAGPLTRADTREAERLAKSPGPGVCVRVTAGCDRRAATGTHRRRLYQTAAGLPRTAASASPKRSFSSAVPTV